MLKNDRLILGSYLVLLLGALALILFASVHAESWKWIRPRMRLALFLVWLISPMAVCALNIFVISRLVMKEGMGKVFLAGSVGLIGSGVLIYSRVYAFPPGGMEPNLVLISGSLYHFLAAALITVVYLAAGAWSLLSTRRDRRGISSR